MNETIAIAVSATTVTAVAAAASKQQKCFLAAVAVVVIVFCLYSKYVFKYNTLSTLYWAYNCRCSRHRLYALKVHENTFQAVNIYILDRRTCGYTIIFILDAKQELITLMNYAPSMNCFDKGYTCRVEPLMTEKQ